MLEQWGVDPEFQAFRIPALFQLLTMSPISDTIASFLADGVFVRFPNLRRRHHRERRRVGAPAHGSSSRRPSRCGDRCTARIPARRSAATCGCRRSTRTTWPICVELIGVDRIIFGSDWPHAEGLAEPLSLREDLDDAGFSQADVDKVMYDNAAELALPVG